MKNLAFTFIPFFLLFLSACSIDPTQKQALDQNADDISITKNTINDELMKLAHDYIYSEDLSAEERDAARQKREALNTQEIKLFQSYIRQLNKEAYLKEAQTDSDKARIEQQFKTLESDLKKIEKLFEEKFGKSYYASPRSQEEEDFVLQWFMLNRPSAFGG